MTKPASRHELTLAVHPTSHGFGWVAFEGAFAPYDWGLSVARGDKNATCLKRVEDLLERLLPITLVLEASSRRSSSRSDRIARLSSALMSLAADRGVQVVVYSRADIRVCFARVGARTRQEIAEAVIRHVDAFRHRLPKSRKPWESEDRRMALFSAAALVLTHYQSDGGRLYEDLSEQAA